MPFQTLLAGLALLLAGCGGVVERSSRDLDENEPKEPAEAPPTDSASDPADGIDPNADTELGECLPGFPATSSRPCAWIVDQRCYAERQMACNCACPRDRDSQCLSGFDNGPDGRVWVACN